MRTLAAVLPVCEKFRSLHHRDPEILFLRKRNAARHHADDGGRCFIKPHAEANDGGIFGEATLPESVPQNGDWRGFGRLVGGNEIAAELRLSANYPERIGADSGSVITFGEADIITEDS